ncbi:MAG: NfeD family protein [Muribaculaceae bacterium]|nr:NfeD family protein [Muribaculaceae bacterium]
MIDYFQNNLWQLWTIIAIVCLIIELMSGDFFFMCFVIGAVVAVVTALCVDSFTAQIVVFALCSALSLWLVRPAALRFLHKNRDDRLSNADALIGQEGRVSQDIVADGNGRVAIDGDDWKAVGSNGQAIAKGTKVRVVARESIILTVEPV